MSFIQSNSTFKLAFTIPNPLVDQVKNLNEADSGKIIILGPNPNGANTQTIMLPAPKVGLVFKFIADDTIARAVIISSLGAAAIINGTLGVSTGAGPFVNNLIIKAAAPTFSFTATAIRGDWAEVICDGVRWCVTGQSGVGNGFA